MAAQLFDGGVHCGAQGASCDAVCCSNATCVDASACSTSFYWECEAPSHCATSVPHCCIAEFVVGDAASCPVEISGQTRPKSTCAGTCPGGAVRLCTTDADCDVGRCTAVKVTPTGNASAVVVGMCR
jgi:hypothetical protein